MTQEEQEFLNKVKKRGSLVFSTGVGVFWLYREARKYVNSDNKEVSKYAKTIVFTFWLILSFCLIILIGAIYFLYF